MTDVAEFRIPDGVEPVVGWRVWRVEDEGVLCADVQGTEWPRREALKAECAGSHLTRSGWAIRWRDGRRDDVLVTPDQSLNAYAHSAFLLSFMYQSKVAQAAPNEDVPQTVLPEGARWEWVREPIPLDHAPDENCNCGIHALKNEGEAHRRLTPDATRVLGEVYLWGKVIQGRDGYRAEYAYPKRLIAPDETTAVKLVDAYGVPVDIRTPEQATVTGAQFYQDILTNIGGVPFKSGRRSRWQKAYVGVFGGNLAFCLAWLGLHFSGAI